MSDGSTDNATSADHPLNRAIDLMIGADQTSPADDLLVKVTDMCAEVPISNLWIAIEAHRTNCCQPSCPVLATMEAHARTREISP